MAGGRGGPTCAFPRAHWPGSTACASDLGAPAREDLVAGAGAGRRRPHSVLPHWGLWDRVSYALPKHCEVRIAIEEAARLHPAGRCWAATTTEGLLIYSLDAQLLFDPFELDTSVTPGRVRAALRQRDFTRAVLMAFRLNERELLQETLESVPWDESEHRAGRAASTPVRRGLGSQRVQRSPRFGFSAASLAFFLSHS